jgi:hypothetical protein
MMKANIQKQKEREHDYFSNVNTMGLRKRTVRARRQQQTVSARVGGLLAVLEDEEFLDLAYGSSLVSSTVRPVNSFLTRCFAGEALIGCRHTRLRTQQVEVSPIFLSLRSRWLFGMMCCFSLIGPLPLSIPFET